MFHRIEHCLTSQIWLYTTAHIYYLLIFTGLSIVSPPWLLRSLAQGTPDRCLHMSLDASRHLPPSVQSRQAPGSSPAPFADGAAFPQDLADRQARQTFVQQLQDQEVHQQWGIAPDCRLGTAPVSVCAAVLDKCCLSHASPVAMPTAICHISNTLLRSIHSSSQEGVTTLYSFSVRDTKLVSYWVYCSLKSYGKNLYRFFGTSSIAF